MRFAIKLCLLIVLMGMLAVGQGYYKEDSNTDIYNITKLISWERLNITFPEYDCNQKEINCGNLINTNRISNIINKLSDTFGYILTEFFKWGIEAGFNNPQYNYQFFFTLIKIALYGMIFWYCGLPLLILLILVGIWIKKKRSKE